MRVGEGLGKVFRPDSALTPRPGRHFRCGAWARLNPVLPRPASLRSAPLCCWSVWNFASVSFHMKVRGRGTMVAVPSGADRRVLGRQPGARRGSGSESGRGLSWPGPLWGSGPSLPLEHGTCWSRPPARWTHAQEPSRVYSPGKVPHGACRPVHSFTAAITAAPHGGGPGGWGR